MEGHFLAFHWITFLRDSKTLKNTNPNIAKIV